MLLPDVIDIFRFHYATLRHFALDYAAADAAAPCCHFASLADYRCFHAFVDCCCFDMLSLHVGSHYAAADFLMPPFFISPFAIAAA